MAPYETVLDVITIGCGVHGIITSKRYLDFNPDHSLLILEGDSAPGGTWSRTRIYPSLRTQNAPNDYRFSDLPIKNEKKNNFGYVFAESINAYMEEYVDTFLKDKVHYETWVVKVSRAKEGVDKGLYIVETKGGFTLYKSKRLIVATGLTSLPNMPEVPREKFTPPLWHFKEFGKKEVQTTIASEESDAKDVTVVGGGKSAYDATFAALKAGKSVHWIIRKNGAGPVTLWPGRMYGLNLIHAGHARAIMMFNASPYKLNRKEFLRNNKFGKWLSRKYHDMEDDDIYRRVPYKTTKNGKLLHPNIEKNFAFYASGDIGILNDENIVDLVFKSDKCKIYRDEIKQMEGDEVELKDGKKFKTDAVMFATGWKLMDMENYYGIADEPYKLGLPVPPESVPKELQERYEEQKKEAEKRLLKAWPLLKKEVKGYKNSSTPSPFRLYRHVVPPYLAAEGDNTLVFMGQINIGTTAFSAQGQGTWAAAYLSGYVKLPSLEEMEKEIADGIVWTETRYKGVTSKVPFLIYDYQAYVDRLMLDLGVKVKRKSNSLKEWFSPYNVDDYKDVVEEVKKMGKKIEASAASNGEAKTVAPVTTEKESSK